jgi:hypothetical protein
MRPDRGGLTEPDGRQGCHTGYLEAFWRANRAGRRAALSIAPYMNRAGYCR